MSDQGKAWLQAIHRLPLTRPVAILNVCGGHERTVVMAGLRTALPDLVRLIPGPGCPVCVCPAEDIAAAMHLSLRHGVRVAAFGDMLRVPVHAHRGEPRSLEEVRAAGGAVHPVASPAAAVDLARTFPDQQVVFLAAGFETTMAPVAAAMVQGLPANFSLLLAGRLTWPIVSLLLSEGRPGFDALIAPGHVCTITGPASWAFVPEQHGLPCAVAGFLPELLLAGLYHVLKQGLDRQPVLANCYPQAVRPAGNPTAQRLLDTAFEVVDAVWRGVGLVPGSGYRLREPKHDAWQRFADHLANLPKGDGMPPGCACASVVLGKLSPDGCPLYGRLCTPNAPVGPCMVSDEGACRIWWRGGIRP